MLICCASSLALAGDLKQVDKLIGKDATSFRLGSWGTHFKKQLDLKAQDTGMDAGSKSKIASLGRRIYTSKNLKSIYRLGMAKYLNNQQLTSLNKWMSSPLGQKIYKGVAELYRDKNIFEKSRKFIAKNQTAANRFNLIRTAVKSSRIAELDGNSQVAADFGIEMCLNGYKRLSAREKTIVVSRRVNIKKDIYERKFEDLYINHFIYVFRALSNDDIDKYRKFLESTNGVAYLMAHEKALQITSEKAAKTAMNSAIKNL
jgi:hypothetical protein